MNSGEKGRQAEESAARFLKSHGYLILERNFRWKGGEIDIIAQKNDLIIFVEVRARSSIDFGTAAETVGNTKREKIRKSAILYIQKKNLDCPLRFDIIAFDGNSMEHIENAFDF